MSNDHAAKKRFGQHFLHDPAVIERIVRSIAPQPHDNLVEIGPGLGALTVPLLQRLERLHVVEIDRDVVPHLLAVCGEAPGLQLHLADALKFDYGTLAAAGTRLRLVGNLPYNISTPLLFHLLQFAPQVRDMHFMLQKEVVDRLTAAPDTDDYGRLTVTVAARAEADYLFGVGPGAFNPPPRVDSSRGTHHASAGAVRHRRPGRCYDELVTASFSQRRKTLANALRKLLPAAEISALGIDPRVRGETLSPQQFALLAYRCHALRR